MDITGFFSAIFVGLVVGALGRLVVPGRQSIPIWLTLVIGIVAALIGTAIAGAVGLTSFILILIIQVVLAAIGVSIVVGAQGRKAVNR
ncbi:MAG: GlsB/YeaQ/YmgE family stress response membrane protein [Actinomycetales bacterium]